MGFGAAVMVVPGTAAVGETILFLSFVGVGFLLQLTEMSGFNGFLLDILCTAGRLAGLVEH